MTVPDETGPAAGPGLGSAVADALARHGVDTVFAIPGTHNLGLVTAVADRGLRVVVTRHEQGAGYAADAYARITGVAGPGPGVGVLVTTTGPGALNAAAALAQAWSDSSATLLVAPGMPTTKPDLPTGRLHEMPDQTAAIAACVDGAWRAHDAAGVDAAVAAVVTRARTGRPRPGYLELPLDLVDSVPTPAAAPAGPDPTHASPALTGSAATTDEPRAVRAAAAALADRERVVVVAGGGARRAAAAVLDLAERLDAWVVTSVNGRGTVDESDPRVLGAVLHLPSVHRLLRDCDAVVVVGCELAESDTWVERIELPATVVRLDVDATMRERNAPGHTVLLPGRAEVTLPLLLAELPERLPRPTALEPAVAQQVRGEALTRSVRWRGLLDGLRDALPADTVVTADNATVAYYAAQVALPVHSASSYLFPTGFGTLGWAVPAAVGAVCAAPHRPVLALAGDGGLMFTVAELATLRDVAVAAGVGVPVVVLDNGGYGEIRDQFLGRGERPVAVDLTAPDWPALAAAFGARCVQPTAHSGDPACGPQVADAVRAAWAQPGVTLVAVRETRP
ncbi:MAG: thiamine pyrophosphate-binding protein [Candidatus Nanopelagicales bacterium]